MKKAHCFTSCIWWFYLPICVLSLLLPLCCIVNKENILCLSAFVLISYWTDTQRKTTTEITLNTLSASLSNEFCYLFTASNLVLWVPDKGSRGRGRPTGTFIDTLTRDTVLQLEERHACLQDKGQWRIVVVFTENQRWQSKFSCYFYLSFLLKISSFMAYNNN